MSSRSAAVGFMAERTTAEKLLGSMVGRMLLCVMQTMVGGMTLMLVLLVWHPADVQVLKYIVVACTGLVAGFSARILLSKRTPALRLASALAAAAVSLGLLGVISGGFVGIDLIKRSSYGVDWAGLFQYGAAMLGAWLALLAPRSRKISMESITPARSRTAERPRARQRMRAWASRIALPPAGGIVQKISGLLPGKRTGTRRDKPPALKVPSPKAKTATRSTYAPKRGKAARTAQTKSEKPLGIAHPRKKKSAKNIRLDSQMVHNCPYCLDAVERHDRRGVKICPICKTYHHADCWGITGACQIPHAQG